jgi:hypothetical protein
VSHSPQESLSPSGRKNRSLVLLAIVVTTGCAITAGATFLGSRRTLSQQPTAPSLPAAEQSKTALVTPVSVSSAAATTPVDPTAPTTTKLPPPDPNFVRVVPLKLPGGASPEAERVLRDLQGAYRCLHTGSKRALAAWLPPSADGAPASMEELSASMQNSLAKLPDACYVTTALPQVINPRTPAALMDVLYQDLGNRPDEIRLRTLFLIAGIESHPRSGEALQNLQALLSTDYQRDWSRWNQAISDQLTRESHGLRGMSCRIH